MVLHFGFEAALSYPAIPARCSECHSYSSARQASGGLGLVVAAIVVTLCGFVSVATHSGGPLLAGGVVSAAYYLWHWHRVALEPLTSEAVASARKSEWVWSLAAVLSVFVN